MEDLSNLLGGFAVALTGPNLLYMLVGITLGILIGVLPGLGGANGVAILLPLTFSMNPTSAVDLGLQICRSLRKRHAEPQRIPRAVCRETLVILDVDVVLARVVRHVRVKQRDPRLRRAATCAASKRHHFIRTSPQSHLLNLRVRLIRIRIARRRWKRHRVLSRRPNASRQGDSRQGRGRPTGLLPGIAARRAGGETR